MQRWIAVAALVIIVGAFLLVSLPTAEGAEEKDTWTMYAGETRSTQIEGYSGGEITWEFTSEGVSGTPELTFTIKERASGDEIRKVERVASNSGSVAITSTGTYDITFLNHVDGGGITDVTFTITSTGGEIEGCCCMIPLLVGLVGIIVLALARFAA